MKSLVFIFLSCLVFEGGVIPSKNEVAKDLNDKAKFYRQFAAYQHVANSLEALSIQILNGAFIVGDSVSVLKNEQHQYWQQGKVVKVSASGRYLVSFREPNYDGSKVIGRTEYRQWFDAYMVEPYAYAR